MKNEKIERNTTVDYARIFAAFGVIAIHVHFSTPAAEAINKIFWPICVSFFFAVSVTYFVAGLKKNAIDKTLRRIFIRIILPYFSWTIIYVGLLAIKNYFVGGHRDFVLWKIIFYGENSLHLYFLPQLVIMQVISLAFFLLLWDRKDNLIRAFALLIIAALFLSIGIHFSIIPSGFLLSSAAYILCAFLLSKRMGTPKISSIISSTGILLVVFAIISFFNGNTYPVFRYPIILPLGGIGVLLITTGVPTTKLSRLLLTLSSITYGIYLSHVLFLELFEFAVNKILHLDIEYTLVTKIGITALIFTLAATFTSIIKKLPFFRQILLGENR